MPNDGQASRNKQIDPVMVAAIAREVIARLKSTSKTNQTAASIDDRVITAGTIEGLSGKPTQIFIAPGAIVTPAARDEARQRGIAIHHTVNLPADQQPNHGQLEIIDAAQPERAEMVRTQLARRGINNGAARVLLSDTPGRDVHQQCTTHDERAVMIATATDIPRFADELAPTIWVLDMKRLNISAATNAVAQITQLGKPTR